MSEGSSVDEEGCWGKTMQLWKRIFPTGFFHEFKNLWQLFAPILGHSLFQIFLWVVPTVFGGHLGSVLATDGIILSLSIMTAFGISVVTGMGTACDTYFSVAFTTDKTRMGIILQAALIVFGIAMIPVISLFLIAGLVFYWVGQNPIAASYCQLYTTILIPGIIAAFLFRILQRYSLSQSLTLPQFLSSLALGLTTLLLHLLFVSALGLGVVGSAISTTLALCAQLLIMMIFCFAYKLFKETWTGWSSESILLAGNFAWLGLHGTLSLAADLWLIEIGVFAAGFIGPTYQAAQTIMVQFMIIWFQLAVTLGAALSIRTGQYLGTRNILAVKTIARVAIFSTFFVVLLGNVILILFRHYISRFYTDNEEVAEIATRTMPYQCILILFDGLAILFKGVFTATGHQSYSFLITMVGYFCLGLPLGLVLLLLTPLNLTGFWLGMSAGSIVQLIVLIVVSSRLDWQNEMLRAAERVKSKQDKSIITITESTPLKPIPNDDVKGDHVTTDDKAQLLDDNAIAYNRKLRVATIKILVVAAAMSLIFVAAIIIRVLFAVPPPYAFYSNSTTTADNFTSSFISNFNKSTAAQYTFLKSTSSKLFTYYPVSSSPTRSPMTTV